MKEAASERSEQGRFLSKSPGSSNAVLARTARHGRILTLSPIEENLDHSRELLGPTGRLGVGAGGLELIGKPARAHALERPRSARQDRGLLTGGCLGRRRHVLRIVLAQHQA